MSIENPPYTYDPKINELIHNDSVRVLGFGYPHDYNLRELKIEQHLRAPQNQLVVDTLSVIARKHNVRSFLAPKVLNNQNEFCHEFKKKPAVEKGFFLPFTDTTLYRDFTAEGCVLQKGEAFVMPAADCIVAVGKLTNGTVVAFHAGRDSLYDKAIAIEGSILYQCASVVDAMYSYLIEGNDTDRYLLENSKWQFLPSISPGPHFAHPWDDPVRGQNNEKVTTHLIRDYGGEVVLNHPSLGEFDLQEILTKQLCNYGVDRLDIARSSECTYKDECAGQHTWHSNRRDQGKSRMRNLFVVINNWI